jgi:hypothetical protein
MGHNDSITLLKPRSHIDCLICAVRPSLTFCKVNILNCSYKCCHNSPPSQAEFSVSSTFQFLNFLCNVVLLASMIEDISEISRGLKAEHLLTFMKISIGCCVMYCNTCYIFATKHKIKEYNGLLSIINHKLLYGLKLVLSEERYTQISRKLFHLVWALCAFELLNLCFLFTLTSAELSRWLSIVASEVSFFALLALLVYFIQNIEIYRSLLDKCFSETESALKTRDEESLLEKLETMQRLYMAIRSNFALSGIFFSPSVIVFYITNTVILIICLTYVTLLYFRGRIEFQTYDCQTFVKAMVVIVGQIFFCFESENLNSLVQEPMSFLFKYPISRLGNGEASRVS